MIWLRYRVENEKIAWYATDVSMAKLKASDLGYAVGDKIRFLKETEKNEGIRGRHIYVYMDGIIEEIYPYFFLVRVGKYRVCVSKVDAWLLKGERCFE